MNHDITSFIKHVNCCMNSKNNAIKKCIVCVHFRGSFDDVIRHIMNDHYGGTTDIVKVEDAGVDETSAKKQSKRQTVSVTATMINQAEEQTEVVLSSTEETSEKIVKRKKANKQKAKKIVKRKKADKRKAPETPKSGKSVEETEAVDDGEKKVKTKKAKKKLKGTKKLKAKNKNARKKQLKKGISQDILPDATGISPIDFNEIKEMPVAKKQKHIECVVIEGSESYGELARKGCKKERTDTNIGVEENNQIDNNITFNARTLKESKKFESRLTTTTLHEIRTFTSDVSESNISVISIKSATKKGEKKYFQYADDEIGHEAKALGATKNDRLAVVQSDRNNDETNQIGTHNFDDHKHKKHVQDTSLHSKINEINQENQMENTKFHNQTRRIDSKFREIDLQKSPYQNHQSPSVNHLREDYRPHNRRRNVYDEIVHGPPSYVRRSNNTNNRFEMLAKYESMLKNVMVRYKKTKNWPLERLWKKALKQDKRKIENRHKSYWYDRYVLRKERRRLVSLIVKIYRSRGLPVPTKYQGRSRTSEQRKNAETSPNNEHRRESSNANESLNKENTDMNNIRVTNPDVVQADTKNARDRNPTNSSEGTAVRGNSKQSKFFLNSSGNFIVADNYVQSPSNASTMGQYFDELPNNSSTKGHGPKCVAELPNNSATVGQYVNEWPNNSATVGQYVNGRPNNSAIVGQYVRFDYESSQYVNERPNNSATVSQYVNERPNNSATVGQYVNGRPNNSATVGQYVNELPNNSATVSQYVNERPNNSATVGQYVRFDYESSQYVNERPNNSATVSQYVNERPNNSATVGQYVNERPNNSATVGQYVNELPNNSATVSQYVNERPNNSATMGQYVAERPNHSATLGQYVGEPPTPGPHQCRQCQQSFQTKSLLSTHEKLHRVRDFMAYPFQCKRCNFRTTNHFNLSKHIRRQHKD
ncbi:hypothetical protein M8J76_005815 [Diaphorina citri]|nr:hypothetical protein M8J76_005815 [Diaphorina citri]